MFLVAEGSHGVDLVGVIFEDSTAAAQSFARHIGGDWPALEDPGGALAKRYLVQGIPRTYFVDGDGILRDQQIGQITQPELDAKVAAIT